MNPRPQQRVTALVPMKNHSERVPGKNFRDFGGQPLALHILNTLLETEMVDTVCVNTDSQRLRDLIHEYAPAVRLHERPPELQGDFVSMNAIIAWDMEQLPGEHFLQTHATNPLLTVDSISRGIAQYFRHLHKYDSLFSVTRHQSRFYHADGTPVNHNPAELLRTQDLPPLYEENSCLYLFSKSSFQAATARIGKRPQLFELSPLEAMDIDTEEDFLLAEARYRQTQEKT